LMQRYSRCGNTVGAAITVWQYLPVFTRQPKPSARLGVDDRHPVITPVFKAYFCCSNATCQQNRSKSSQAAAEHRGQDISRMLPFTLDNSMSSTLTPYERFLVRASRAQRVHEVQPLDFGSRFFSYRRLLFAGPIGNRPRERNVYAWYCISYRRVLHCALRDHFRDRIGDFCCVH
jgi:hypothetical protein